MRQFRVLAATAAVAFGIALMGSGGTTARAQVLSRLGATRQATAPNWDALAKIYAYDAHKPLEMKEEPKPVDKALRIHLSFAGANGEKVPGMFLRPQKDGVYPVILLLHGLTGSKEDLGLRLGMPLVERGFAVLALDAPHHGERRVPNENQWQLPIIETAVLEGTRDYRRALDYLATRKDVDMKHVGALGYSMGSFMAAILTAVDSRVKAAVLCVSGDPFLPMAKAAGARDEKMWGICPSLYVAHISPRPILMLNGKQDNTVRPTTTKIMFDAAAEPKQNIWYDSGHLLPKEAMEKAVEWIEEKASGK